MTSFRQSMLSPSPCVVFSCVDDCYRSHLAAPSKWKKDYWNSSLIVVSSKAFTAGSTSTLNIYCLLPIVNHRITSGNLSMDDLIIWPSVVMQGCYHTRTSSKTSLFVNCGRLDVDGPCGKPPVFPTPTGIRELWAKGSWGHKKGFSSSLPTKVCFRNCSIIHT